MTRRVGLAEGRRELIATLVVVATAAATLAPGLAGGFVWDDWMLIVRNEHIRDPANLPRVLSSPFWEISGQAHQGRAAYSGLWRPWVSLAYVSQFQLFGESPFGYHMVGLALHLTCVGLAYAWLRSRLQKRAGVPLACAIGALLFAVHPSRPETVSWISGSTDLWMTFWVLLGMLALDRDKRLIRAIGALCFALAVWSKEAALLVPLLLLADAWFLETRGARMGREGLAALGALTAVLIRFVVGPGGPDAMPTVGAQAPLRVLSTIGHFVSRTVMPYPPTLDPAMRSLDAEGYELFATWSIVVGVLTVAGVLVLVLAARRFPATRPWAADCLWYLVLLAPVSNVLDLGSQSLVADRYLYLPMLGVSALVARGLVVAFGRSPATGRASASVGIAAVVVLACFTAVRATHFESDSVLWSEELRHNPQSVNARRVAAKVAEASGDREAALDHLIAGAESARARGAPYMSVRFLLDAASLVLKKTPDAEQDQLVALRRFYDRLAEEPVMQLELDELHISAQLTEADWRNARGDLESFLIPRASSHVRTLQLEEAEAQLRAIVEESPRQPAAWNLLIAVHGRQGEWQRAGEAAQQAERHLPGSGAVSAMTASLLRARRLALRATDDPLQRAVWDAQAQVELGAPEAARRILDAALEAHPGAPLLIVERAKVDVADGRFDLAREVLQRARDSYPAREDLWTIALERLLEAEHDAQGPDGGSTAGTVR